MQYLVLLGAALNIYGTWGYLVDTLKGKTQPNRMSWFLWAATPLIGTAAALAKGATWITLPVFAIGLCDLAVFVVSFVNPKAYWKLQLLDWACGLCSVLALVLWAITKEPNYAIIFAILSDGLAAVPTVVKAWQHPETESGFVYITSFISALTSFAAVRTWSFAEIGFPIYMLGINIVLVLTVYRKPRSS